MLKYIRDNWFNLKSSDKFFNYPRFDDETLVENASFTLFRSIYNSEKNLLIKRGFIYYHQSMYPNSLERQKVALTIRIFIEKSYSTVKNSGTNDIFESKQILLH